MPSYPETQGSPGLGLEIRTASQPSDFILFTSVSPALRTMKVTQLCPTHCDSMDYTVHGILQARILEWTAVPFSRGSSQPRD